MGMEMGQNVRGVENAGKNKRNKSRRKFWEGIYDQDFLIRQTILFAIVQKKTIDYLWGSLGYNVSIMTMVAEGIKGMGKKDRSQKIQKEPTLTFQLHNYLYSVCIIYLWGLLCLFWASSCYCNGLLQIYWHKTT